MEIGQRFLVIDPADLGHKALDEAKHAPVAVASLVEESLGARGVLWRRQIEKGEEVTRLVVRALLLKFGAALDVDQSRRHIRKMTFGIFACRIPLRLDKDSPTRTEPTQRIVQSPRNADEFRRHGGIQVRTPKLGGALKRTILVEDDSFVDQSRPGQEIHELRSGAAIF